VRKVVLLLAFGLLGCGESPDQQAISKAESVVKAKMNDPESAQFSGEWIPEESPKGDATVCGYVNAKNLFGGYVGRRRFVYHEIINDADIDPADMSFGTEAFEVVWGWCSQGPKNSN
jgi:hypothetical protein